MRNSNCATFTADFQALDLFANNEYDHDAANTTLKSQTKLLQSTDFNIAINRETNAAEDLASTQEIHEEHHQYYLFIPCGIEIFRHHSRPLPLVAIVELHR
jgi:hypothetical protein